MIDLAQAAHEAATVRKATPRELDSLAAVLARAAQPRALPAARIQGHRAVLARTRVAAALADVADPQRVNLSMPAPPAAA